MTVSTPTIDTELEKTLDEIRHRVTKEAVTKQIDEFIEIISSDGFIDYVNGIAELPTYSERREYTAATATLTTLEQHGVPMADGLRIATREFEMPEDGRASASPLVHVRPGTDPRMGFCVSIGYILCASYGG
ncbi:hypothetical protein [Curtobacterium pusillum]|uniref:hypothetical protein n=1 Tax=Curtobacterium pusillum TaxID=69373 RepID=UPI0021B4ACD1|nr:hypothetical protein [Curtobacterium pusillum]